MNKTALACVLLALSAVALGKAPLRVRDDFSQRVMTLNIQSKSQLGVGLLALSLLGDVGPGRYYPMDNIVETGRWPKYQELKAAGFVIITLSKGLPDGSEKNSQFVGIELTRKGQQLRAALLRP